MCPAPVTVTGAGHTASYHTDASGYADVYLKTGGPASGPVSAQVGASHCTGRL